MPETDRVLVAVGVDHDDVAVALGERRTEDGHDRGDARAGREQDEILIEVFGGEDAGRGQDVHVHAGLRVVAEPVRAVAVDRPLDRHLELGVLGGRARQ